MPPIANESGVEKAGKTALIALNPDMRTRRGQVVVEIVEAIIVEMGGAANLSTRQRELVEQAAVATAMLRDVADRYLGGEAGLSDEFARLARSHRALLDEARGGAKKRAARPKPPGKMERITPAPMQRLGLRPGRAA